MGYSLPLTFVKVSVDRTDNNQFDSAICVTRIVALMSTKIYQARQTLAAERKAGTLINAAGSSKVKTAIFLDNGSVVASPLTVNRILRAIEKAGIKADPNTTKSMKVYDVPHYEEDSEEDDNDDYDDEDDLYDDEDEDEE